MANSQALSPCCKVCKNLAEADMQIYVGELLQSARNTKCAGCVFLYVLSDQIHTSMHGRSMDSSRMLCVNYGLLYPPKEFLILPNDNIIAQTGKIEVFKTHPRGAACPWPTIRQSSITSGDTGSVKCHSTIITWLNECVESHSACKHVQDPYLPSRVLDLCPALPEDSASISLLETETEQRGSYCCLSHRWIDGETPITTRDNLDERKKSIVLADLPAKYRDAITFTRSLGIRYLWIDSLCILQQDSADWAKEAPKMAEYYGNGHLTISASVAVEPGQRLFCKASSGTGTINMSDGTDVLYAVHYRLPLSHRENPLHSRGWIFQEYMLSRRVVHFLEDEVIWECRQAIHCECSRVSDDFTGTSFVGPIADSAFQSFAYRRKARFHESLHSSASPLRLKNVWMELVHAYTQKQLTFASDVFPALAGLAKEMQAQRRCAYYAGLWQDSLVSDMLWEAEDPEWYPDGYKYAKPEQWRAPSWSWAASSAVINWPHCPVDSSTGEFQEQDLMGETFVRGLSVECRSLGGDVFMGIEDAELRLTGTLSIAPLVVDDTMGYAVSDKARDFGVALDHTLTTEEIVEPDLLRTVLVTKITVGDFVSLVLRPTGRKEYQFERIGLFHHPARLQDIEVDVSISII